MIRDILKGRLDERFIKRFIFLNWCLSGLIFAGALVFFGPKMAMGSAVGSIVANINCAGLGLDCKRIVRWQNMFVYYAGLAVRLGLITLAVTAALLMFPAYISPVGLFLGLSVAVINFYILVITVVINRICLKEAV
ncbi:MAG: hypothetical protein M0022_07975 [Desulfobacteraceae bacterium]|nr:hypothetical protein [Desulfobacteraceae bacterium]